MVHLPTATFVSTYIEATHSSITNEAKVIIPEKSLLAISVVA